MDNLPALIIKNCQISSSQEEILNDDPFFGEPVNSAGDGVPPTLPETAQDVRENRGFRDIFVTPPANQSYSFDFQPCVSHKSVHTDDETQDFHDFTGNADEASCVDLSDDSDFRFLLTGLNRMGDPTMVASCSRRDDGAEIEISNHKTDKLHVSGRELFPEDSTGEPPHKIMKTSEENLCSKCSEACSGIEESVENPEAECTGGDNTEDDTWKPLNLRITLPSSVLTILKKKIQGMKENEKADSLVFDVFKCLTKEISKRDDVENVDWLEFAKFKGITFPTPWWWKKTND